jgi:hypothetical protein
MTAHKFHQQMGTNDGFRVGGHVLKKRSFRLHITTLILMSIRCRWTIEMELNVYFINISAQRLWASNTGFLRTTAMIYLSLICYCFTIYRLPLISGSRCSSFSIVSGYGLDDRAMRFDSGRGKRIVPLDSVSRPALGPTQPPVQCVPRVLSPGGKAAGAWYWPFAII